MTRGLPVLAIRVLYGSTGACKVIRDFIFLVLFFIFLGIWAVSWFAFHIAGGMIHLLLIVAAISLLLHLFRGSRTA
jgi:small neutral amino acid transporter SnatA (MarC family)